MNLDKENFSPEDHYGEPDPEAQEAGAEKSSAGGTGADLTAILDGMVREIRRHVVLGPYYAEAVALWVLHAHGIAACDYSPRLNIRSPEPECGKSTLLKVIRAFCDVRGAKIKISTTAASYFRQVEMKTKQSGMPPIMILDEIDNFFDAENRQAYAILNGGHSRETSYVDRCGSIRDELRDPGFLCLGTLRSIRGRGVPGQQYAGRSTAKPLHHRQPQEADEGGAY